MEESGIYFPLYDEEKNKERKNGVWGGGIETKCCTSCGKYDLIFPNFYSTWEGGVSWKTLVSRNLDYLPRFGYLEIEAFLAVQLFRL